MAESMLAKLIEHNNWANRQMIRACLALGNDQLDARPLSAEQWSIRENLVHLVNWQQDYLSLLTQERTPAKPSFGELEGSAHASGDGLLALDAKRIQGQVETSDGYRVERWVVMLQAINHATEHRKQIANLMRAQGLEAPWQDGWAFGEAEHALVRIS
ncbi:MAG: DinB family protein [Planctomycetota bacterium]|jgi:uncharacterized damage-inducible protein DinB